jgi:hypothetical protein
MIAPEVPNKHVDAMVGMEGAGIETGMDGVAE